jgi:ABC-type cobalamin/Fe3+-siderophores transport system ATPase subunit
VVCLNTEIIGQGTPRHTLTADILERTYGAPMEILEHAGMPIVLDHFHHGRVVPLRRRTGA